MDLVRGGWAISEVVLGLSAKGLRATAYMHAHRHGRLVIDLGLDGLHWNLVQPLGIIIVAGLNFVHSLHVNYFLRADSPP